MTGNGLIPCEEYSTLNIPALTDDRSLGTALPAEQARVREVLGHYREIGPAGAFACAMMERALRAADTAVMSGDVVAMIGAYQELKGFRE